MPWKKLEEFPETLTPIIFFYGRPEESIIALRTKYV
jgi:hypothetical protein